ncbi:MAG: hypothetical protein ABJA02_02905 [Acidobacteriota bacterium]
MKKLVILSVATLFLAIAAQASFGQTGVHTPEKGSPERKAILDAVRKYRKASSEIYSPTAFRVSKDWAFVAAPDPSDPDVDTEAFEVILRKTGTKWKVVDELKNVEGTDPAVEVKRVHRKFPSLPMAVLNIN